MVFIGLIICCHDWYNNYNNPHTHLPHSFNKGNYFVCDEEVECQMYERVITTYYTSLGIGEDDDPEDVEEEFRFVMDEEENLVMGEDYVLKKQ